MKNFITGFKDKLATAVGEQLEKHRPGATAELEAVRDQMARHANELKQTLNEKAVEAKVFAQQIASDERTQRAMDRLSDGVGAAKNGLSGAVSSVVSAVTERGSPATGELQPDATAEQERLSATIAELNGRDKVGVSAEILGTTGGVAAGAAAAGTVASLAGASTILGSTTLGSALGGIFVASTPVGWVIGSAVVAGAAGYGIAKLARSGARQDELRKEIISRLRRRQQALEKENAERRAFPDLGQLTAAALAAGSITEAQALRLVGLVERGSLSVEAAVQRLGALAQPATVRSDCDNGTE